MVGYCHILEYLQGDQIEADPSQESGNHEKYQDVIEAI